MPRTAKSFVAPAYLLACLILGGSAQGVWQNMVLQLLGLGEGHAREGDGGNVDLLPEGAFDLIRVLLCDAREHMRQPLLLEGHHVLVRIDP